VSTPCILDCDPGHDDAMAIILAAAHPAIDLRAITTVAGNGTLEKVTFNARAVATLAGIEGVPIAAGAAGPRRGELVTAADVHGESALDGADLPDPTVDLDPRPAADLIVEALRAADEPITLLPVGPLTNIAEVLERAPDVRDRIREIVLMGGSTERGNVTPAAEFNIFVDPEAAGVVFSSGLPLTMAGLNLTHQALVGPDVLARLRALDTELARAAVGWMTFFGDAYADVEGMVSPPLHDPCAVARVIDPTLIRCVDAFVAVETEGRYTRGATVVDLEGRLGREANARVAMELDAKRFFELVVGAVEKLG
jgi:purine nucleosidase